MEQSVIGVIFDEKRRSVLLIQRRDVPVWVLPGGGLEKDEKPEAGVVREVLEETGFSAEIIRKVGEYTPLNRMARFTHLFECRIVTGKATLSDESKAVQFFPLDALPKLFPPPYGEWVQEAYQNGPLIQRPLTSVNYRTLFKYFLLHPLLVGRFILSKIGLTINT